MESTTAHTNTSTSSDNRTMLLIVTALIAGIIIGNIMPSFMSVGNQQGATIQTEKTNNYLKTAPVDPNASRQTPVTQPQPTAPFTVQLISSNQSVSSVSGINNDLGTFDIKVRITAVKGDVYMSSVTGAVGFNYAIDKSGVVVSSGISSTLTNVTDSDKTPNNNYLIEEGSSEDFIVTSVVMLPAAGTSGMYKMSLTGIAWSITDSVTPTSSFPLIPIKFETSYLSLN